MRKYKRLLSILFLSLLFAGLIMAPALAQDDTTPPGSAEPTPVVEPPPVEQPPVEQLPVPEAAPEIALLGTVNYTIYATDGFISLADGTALYMYGFIGGRAGPGPVTYQNSVVAPPGAPKTYVPGAAVSIPNWPTPTGGPWTAAETPLAGNAQFPAPVIYAAAPSSPTATDGDVVQINFKNLGVTDKNAPNDPHSIHLHGLDVNAANDGVPETSVGAVPANLAVPGAGNVIVYMFAPKHPGTYMYHCHQEADIHVQMGMYGALVVYNPTDPAYLNGGPGKGFGGTLWGWNYDKDYILLLSEIDVRQHVSEQNALGGGAAFNPVNYQPQYWLINGLSFPNTIHAAGGPKVPFTWGDPTVTNCSPPPTGKTCGWINAHPNYDPFIIGSVAAPGQKVLLRVINMGFETQPMHMHGFHGKILGSDQRAWTWANNPTNFPTGSGLEKNTLTIGSGETYEWLLDFGTWATPESTYEPGTQSRYYDGTTACKNAYTAANPTLPVPALNTPVANTLTACPAIPVPAVPGATYTGGSAVGWPTGILGAAPNPSGQLFPFHNHDDYKATNNGVYPGGMFTMIMTTP